jgi:uncharacterized protein (UPF0212 family)
MSVSSPSARLLAVWDGEAARAPARRVLALLRVADPSATDEELATLSLGEADRRLLAFRDATFGARFDAVSRCPRCQEPIELSFASADFALAAGAPYAHVTREVEVDGYHLEVRPPTVADIIDAADAGDAHEALVTLLERCVPKARSRDGELVTPAALPPRIVEAAGEALEAADPLACTRIQLECPACGESWSSVFDVSAYLWEELESWAKSLLGEVHLIASAYGWQEADILALSPRRRREYLEMIVA